MFDASHRVLLRLIEDGVVSGLRIDHPDGLADPRAYLRTCATRSGGAWVVVEKIVEGDEALPADWACAGTTGYDALQRICGLFVDPAGRAGPGRALAELATPGDPASLTWDAGAGAVPPRRPGRDALAGGRPARRRRVRGLPVGGAAARLLPARADRGAGGAARRDPGLPRLRRPR